MDAETESLLINIFSWVSNTDFDLDEAVGRVRDVIPAVSDYLARDRL